VSLVRCSPLFSVVVVTFVPEVFLVVVEDVVIIVVEFGAEKKEQKRMEQKRTEQKKKE
jgi:hypothetical protein